MLGISFTQEINEVSNVVYSIPAHKSNQTRKEHLAIVLSIKFTCLFWSHMNSTFLLEESHFASEFLTGKFVAHAQHIAPMETYVSVIWTVNEKSNLFTYHCSLWNEKSKIFHANPTLAI